MDDLSIKIKLGYKLTTLQVIYFMPDYRNLLNEFVWQFLDINPAYPRAHKFLLYWKDAIDAPIKEVNIVQEGDIYSKPFKVIDYLETITYLN